MSWLYYEKETESADRVLSDNSITTVFSKGSM